MKLSSILFVVLILNLVLQIVYGVVLTVSFIGQNPIDTPHRYLQPSLVLLALVLIYFIGERLMKTPVSRHFQEDDHFALTSLTKSVSLFVIFLQTGDFLPSCPVRSAAELACVTHMSGGTPLTYYREIEIGCLGWSQARQFPQLAEFMTPDPAVCPPAVLETLCSCDVYMPWLVVTFWEVVTGFILIILHNEQPTGTVVLLRAAMDFLGPWAWLQILTLETDQRILPLGLMTICFFATLNNLAGAIGVFALARLESGEGYTKRIIDGRQEQQNFEMSAPTEEPTANEIISK